MSYGGLAVQGSIILVKAQGYKDKYGISWLMCAYPLHSPATFKVGKAIPAKSGVITAVNPVTNNKPMSSSRLSANQQPPFMLLTRPLLKEFHSSQQDARHTRINEHKVHQIIVGLGDEWVTSGWHHNPLLIWMLVFWGFANSEMGAPLSPSV